jgi:cephalosporin hydroxylase
MFVKRWLHRVLHGNHNTVAEAPDVLQPAKPTYLENSLDLPLRRILPVMQERLVTRSTYFGVPALKNPTDFWIYQEIIYELKPDVIIEIGNRYGGSTLALAHLCDLMGKGKVIGIDISHELVHETVRAHPRITLIEGDACASLEKVAGLTGASDQVLIIEDSSHTYENTLDVLRTFNSLIKPGGYFIVEDGICYHGLDLGPRPGPYEAIEAFVAENPSFEIDRGKEDFLITWNPKGFLRRVR